MTRNLAALKTFMEAELQRLDPSPDWRESIAVGPNGDMVDTSQQATTREMVCRDLNRQAELRGHLRGAIDRIADGAYGVCTQCDEPIHARRLAAVPWAPLCLFCQEELEAGRRREDLAA